MLKKKLAPLLENVPAAMNLPKVQVNQAQPALKANEKNPVVEVIKPYVATIETFGSSRINLVFVVRNAPPDPAPISQFIRGKMGSASEWSYHFVAVNFFRKRNHAVMAPIHNISYT